VQQHRSLNHIYDLFDKELGYVQYTIQKFYRINGGSTQNRGVVPDIAYPTAIDPAETGESVEDNALPWDQIDPAKYQTLADQTALISKLTTMHEARIAEDLEFSFIAEDIQDYKSKKENNLLSLNLDKRNAEDDGEEDIRLDRINMRRANDGLEPLKSLDDLSDDYEAPDPYLDETVNIMMDMIKA
jgi:carboxyl-terminal processing protease